MKEKPTDHLTDAEIDSKHEDDGWGDIPGAAAITDVAPKVGKKQYKKEKNDYVQFLSEALKKAEKAGHLLPLLKNTKGEKKSFQFKGHSHVWDALQGYWERNNRVYIHAAKVHYRALYLGSILMLEEEALRDKADNKDTISKLEIYCEEKKSRHKTYRTMAALREELKHLLKEKNEGIISQEDFEADCKEMISTFSSKEDQIKFSILLDNMIADEEVKYAQNKRQAKHRQLEAVAKGIREVT